MKASTSEKPFLTELFDKLEDRYESPKPHIVAGNVAQFGRFLKGVLLPFVGINAFLIGSILYRKNTLTQLDAALIGTLLLLPVWVLLLPVQQRRTAWIDLGGIASLVLMASLTLPGSWFPFIAGLLVTAICALAVVLELVPQTSTIVWVAYLPWFAWVELPQTFRVAFELLSLVPLETVFLARKLRVASIATLVSAALVVFVELSRIGHGDLFLIILTSACVVLAIWHEMRGADSDQSSLRQFVGQGLMVSLAWAAVMAVGDSDSSGSWWTWACAVSIYQAVQLTRERLTRPTRAGWIALPVAFCLWTQSPDWFHWPAVAISTLLLAAALHRAAKQLGTRLLSHLAVLLAGIAAMVVLVGSSSEVSALGIASAVLIYAFLAFASGSPAPTAAVPWFRGFLRPDHVLWVRRATLVALAQLLRTPIAGTVFHGLRLAFTWLKYLVADEGGLRLSSLIFAGAQVFGATFWTTQIEVMAGAATLGDRVLLITAAVWIPWAFLIALWGRQRHSLFYLVLAIAFVAVPTALQFESVHSKDPRTLSLLTIVTGLGAWFLAAATRSGSREQRSQTFSSASPRVKRTSV